MNGCAVREGGVLRFELIPVPRDRRRLVRLDLSAVYEKVSAIRGKAIFRLSQNSAFLLT